MTEFGFIEQIRTRFASLPDNGFEGIGDDCAVLPIGGGESLVFTADLLIEGVHFLRTATTARELGGKSLAVNLSDVAAMGARPVATLLSIALPPDRNRASQSTSQPSAAPLRRTSNAAATHAPAT